MSAQACDAYLESLVRTATPQRLRLMLIDGAIRFARQALANWDREEHRTAVYESIVRCRAIIMELYGSIQQDASPVAKQVASIYLYLFRLLAEAPATHDAQKVREVMGVLEEERETWRQLCEQMPEPPEAMAGDRSQQREITAGNSTVTSPTSQGFSLDA
jgi:flagellar protein FliS